MRSPQPPLRREVVSNDPLLEAANTLPAAPVGRTTSPIPSEYSFEPPSYPRPVSVMDQIELYTESFLKYCRKKPIKDHDVPSNVEGLKELANGHAWPYVVALSGKMLYEQEDSVSDNAIWQLRFKGLFRMKMYDELATEANNMLTYEESKDQSEINPNIVVSMKILLLEVKVMTGRNQEALDQLYLMRRWLLTEPFNGCQNINSYSTRFWQLQVGSHIVNTAVRLRSWRTVINELRQLLCDVKSDIKTLGETLIAGELLALKRSQVMILLRLSRVLLQIGAVKDSTAYFERASQLCTADVTISQDCNIESHLMLNQGLILMCGNTTPQYTQALDIFTTIMDAERATKNSISSSSSEEQINPTISTLNISDNEGKQSRALMFNLFVNNEETILASAVNNAAICALYLKQIAQAIHSFEALIIEDPTRHMTDPVIFNLCTLYDLSFAPDTSTTKKKVLQKVATKFGVDDPILHWRSFRLT